MLDRVDADDDVRAVIVTGEGRAFCAGADISGGARAFEPTPARADEPAVAPRDGGGILALRIHALQKPIIGAINGAAVGMGATMTLPMDVRLASVEARFGFLVHPPRASSRKAAAAGSCHASSGSAPRASGC